MALHGPRENELHSSYGRRIARCKSLPLMPVGIDRPRLASVVQTLHLLCRELELDAAKVVPQLRGIACADHQRRHGRPLQRPVQRDLRNASTELGSDRAQQVDHGIELLERQLRAVCPERRACMAPVGEKP